MSIPATTESLYAALGISADATPEEIKRAYRKIVKTAHPDQGGSADHFAKVQLAWHVLGDPERRARYEATGETGSQPGPDNTAAMIHSLIMGALERVMRSDVDYTDLVTAAARDLDNQAAEGKNVNGEMRAAKKKLEKVRKRLRFKGEGVDLIDRTLADKIADIDRHIAANEKTMAQVREAAQKLRDGWSYETDQRQADPWGTSRYSPQIDWVAHK